MVVPVVRAFSGVRICEMRASQFGHHSEIPHSEWHQKELLRSAKTK
jgi:hypothetical protein